MIRHQDIVYRGILKIFPSDRYPMNIAYLGQPCEAVDYLTRNAGKVDQLYCSLPSARSAEIVPIINYCENHLIRFFQRSHYVRNYLKRRMYFEMLGNVPVLSIRREPLELLENRIMKRGFDIICSLLFLCTLFPIIHHCGTGYKDKFSWTCLFQSRNEVVKMVVNFGAISSVRCG